MSKMAWNESGTSVSALQRLYQQEKEKTAKSETRNKICWCICFTIFLAAAIVAFLLLGYTYTDSFKTKESSTTEGCDSILAEYNNTFKMILRDLCEATCSKRSQDTSQADLYNVVNSDTISMAIRCFQCCQHLDSASCEAQDIPDEVPVNDCRWVLVSSGGGGCVSIGTMNSVIG